MEHINTRQSLLEYNRIFKENNKIYHELGKNLGLPECTMWILYTLRESDEIHTQSEISSIMYQPKQTVNSALKKLENDGYIKLTEMTDRRSKQIHLTEKGEELCKKTVDSIIDAENRAFSKMNEDETKTFLVLFRKYTEFLKDSIQSCNITELNKGEKNENTVI